MTPSPNPNPPPKDPVRMSRQLRHALITHRRETGLRYIDIAAAIELSPSMLSQLLNGKVVGRGDPRLLKVGQYIQGLGLDVLEWEEPA